MLATAKMSAGMVASVMQQNTLYKSTPIKHNKQNKKKQINFFLNEKNEN
jgi:hypothetical protein